MVKKAISVKKRLIELAHKAECAKHPSLRPALVPRETYNVNKANGLTKAVIHWIRLHGGQAERISVTGRRIDMRKRHTNVLGHHQVTGSVKWIPGSMQRGSADVSSTILGRSVKVEIKIGRA